jgi:winged helix DNA-binding protein
VIIAAVEVAEIRARRAVAQLLHRPAGGGPHEIVTSLLAVQAQDARAARLALRARGTGQTAAGVDAAQGEDGPLVVAWLMRTTLHLVARDDYPWLLGLTAPTGEAAGARRLAQLGVRPDDAERAVAIVERALAADGPLTRPELAERIAAAGIPTEGQAAPHLLGLAARRGVAVLGPVRDGERCFALTRDRLGDAPALPLEGEARDLALAELARRFVAAHGPATAADLAAWAGLPQRDARAGLAAIAGDLAQEGELVDLAARPRADAAEREAALEPRLLPAFDPWLLHWKDRSFAVPAAHAKRVYPGGGMLRAVATADGRAVATWGARRQGGRLAVEVEPFRRLPAAVRAALEAEADDVVRFEGAIRAG